MISFPNAKINLGLNVTEKRADGYHNIETVMYPIPLCNILEIIPSGSEETTLTISGIDIPDNDGYDFPVLPTLPATVTDGYFEFVIRRTTGTSKQLVITTDDPDSGVNPFVVNLYGS